MNGRGAGRWERGHPWIFKSDLIEPPGAAAGVVTVADARGKRLGVALWSPRSEISLRLLDRNPDATVDLRWWRQRVAAALARRASIVASTNAFRVLHGEADGCPSLVVDRYDRWIVVQLLSAGIETVRTDVVRAIQEEMQPLGILARNDVPVRSREGMAEDVELLSGDVPRGIEVNEHGVRYLAAPWDGQKTGAFLDQRENRVLAGQIARGRALDCFSYHGSFALHLARGAERVTAVDVSTDALTRAAENAARNGLTNIEFREADAFDLLRSAERSRANYETIVLDPPAFAKSRSAVPAALRGYKEINLRAMRLLSPGGMLLTASCSFHLSRPMFLDMLREAASDSGRRLVLRSIHGQPLDHPEMLTIPETGYLKSALVEAL